MTLKVDLWSLIYTNTHTCTCAPTWAHIPTLTLPYTPHAQIYTCAHIHAHTRMQYEAQLKINKNL